MRKGPIALAASATLLLCGAVGARPVTYAPPPETVPPMLADGAGEIVVNTCSACHSLEYISTQPRGKGPQFWKDAVTKMINVYKAPIAPEDADAVTAALASKFG